MSKTFVNQVPPATGRKYNIVSNGDGTSSITDVTEYLVEGTPFTADDANQSMRKEDFLNEDGTAVPVDKGGTGATNAADARTNLGAASATDMTSAQTNIIALQNAATTLFTTAGTAPAFTVADASVTAYATGLRRTVQFHADGTNATLNFNGKGAKALYEYTGKQMSVKAGQVVEVCYNGTYFFGVSVGGGGVSYPATIAAGDTPLIFKLNYAASSSLDTAYSNIGTALTIKKAGTYRFKYGMKNDKVVPYYGMSRLTKNGTAVSGSETSSTGGAISVVTVDISCAVNDVIRFQGAYSGAVASGVTIVFLGISILAADIETAIATMIM